MSKELSMPISTAAQTANRTAGLTWLRMTGIAIAGTVFVAACAHIALPLFFTPVPLTMQTFAVLLLALLLPPRLAAASMLAYLLEGMAGLPVFAPGPLGLPHLAGPTGGYLLSYPLAVVLTSYAFRRTSRGFTSALLATAAGSLVILACGAIWYVVSTHAPIQLALAQTVLPFLPGDALKIAATAGTAVGLARLRRPGR